MSSKKKGLYSEQKSFQNEYKDLTILQNGSLSLQLIQQTIDSSEEFLQDSVIQTYKNAQQTYQNLMRSIKEAEQLRVEIQQPLQVCADIIERYLIIKSNAALMILYIIDKVNDTLGSGLQIDQANNVKLLSKHDIEGELFYLNKLCSVLVRLYLHIKKFQCANDIMVIKRNIRSEQFQDTVYIKRFYKEPQMQMEFTGDGLFDTIGRFAIMCYTSNLNIDRQNRLNVFEATDQNKILQRVYCLLALGTCLLCKYNQNDQGLVLILMGSQFLSEIDNEKATAQGTNSQAPGILNKQLHYDITYIIDLTKDRSAIYDVFRNHILRCSQAKTANSKLAKKV